MMRSSNDLPAVYLYRDIVDFRKGINGLAIVVEETRGSKPNFIRILCGFGFLTMWCTGVFLEKNTQFE